MACDRRINLLIVEDIPDRSGCVEQKLRRESGVSYLVSKISRQNATPALLIGCPFDVVLLNFSPQKGQGHDVIEVVRDSLPNSGIVILVDAVCGSLHKILEKFDVCNYLVKSENWLSLLPWAIQLSITQRNSRSDPSTNEERFRKFVDIGSDYYWELDAQLRFTYVSRQFEDITGVPVIDMIGRTRQEFLAHYGSRVVATRELGGADNISRLIENRMPVRDFEFIWITANGEEQTFRASCYPFFGAGASFQGYRGGGVSEVVEI